MGCPLRIPAELSRRLIGGKSTLLFSCFAKTCLSIGSSDKTSPHFTIADRTLVYPTDHAKTLCDFPDSDKTPPHVALPDKTSTPFAIHDRTPFNVTHSAKMVFHLPVLSSKCKRCAP
jgi:hypothetical protein